MSGKFVMVEGLDGSGKGVVVNTLKEYFDNKGLKVFDLREHCKEHLSFPEFSEIEEYDVIINAEPTYSHVGIAIRDEIIRENERKYSGLSTAHAFALDREILYKKLLIPALEKGKTVIQERGLVTSFVYQPIQLERISLKDILNIPGNRLALKYRPDLLIITKVDPQVVIHRLKNREKKDNAIFEKLVFQRQVANRYESEWLSKLFSGRGSQVQFLDTNYPKTVEDTQKAAIEMWEEFDK
ncbi:deoxynucleoside kinase [Candidatus Woesearchaeota archaeon]|nr:deoxynucleoside kinase [Candidatus Woesearchaeota archaeon]MBT5271753.1 deoxynucleoside kinase [Candidatus Woesearchaeota archaeon]MBT6041568.1 deoxynucleoside kinase [Candidatus Woesearchaeota archaeon]MBT6337383.1 deoxynucleoside kinase [Candidatus Woesearchaeota archaeon]MBT7927287.1 deoxynucleoside kinase [Candidatus Woesearchaeota archaeon]